MPSGVPEHGPPFHWQKPRRGLVRARTTLHLNSRHRSKCQAAPSPSGSRGEVTTCIWNDVPRRCHGNGSGIAGDLPGQFPIMPPLAFSGVKCRSSEDAKCLARCEVALGAEDVVDGGMNRQKSMS